MRIEELHRKLDLIGKGGYVSLSDSERMQSVQLPDRVLRFINDPESPLPKVPAYFSFDDKPQIFFFENPRYQRL